MRCLHFKVFPQSGKKKLKIFNVFEVPRASSYNQPIKAGSPIKYCHQNISAMIQNGWHDKWANRKDKEYVNSYTTNLLLRQLLQQHQTQLQSKLNSTVMPWINTLSVVLLLYCMANGKIFSRKISRSCFTRNISREKFPSPHNWIFCKRPQKVDIPFTTVSIKQCLFKASQKG